MPISLRRSQMNGGVYFSETLRWTKFVNRQQMKQARKLDFLKLQVPECSGHDTLNRCMRVGLCLNAFRFVFARVKNKRLMISER